MRSIRKKTSSTVCSISSAAPTTNPKPPLLLVSDRLASSQAVQVALTFMIASVINSGRYDSFADENGAHATNHDVPHQTGASRL